MGKNNWLVYIAVAVLLFGAGWWGRGQYEGYTSFGAKELERTADDFIKNNQEAGQLISDIKSELSKSRREVQEAGTIVQQVRDDINHYIGTTGKEN